VGRLVPAEEDAVSEAPEWELRKRRKRVEERRVENRGAGCRGGTTNVPAHALFHGIRGQGVGDGLALPFVSSFVIPLVRIYSWDRRERRAKRGACNTPPSREQWTGSPDKKCAAILDRLNASMNKQKRDIVCSCRRAIERYTLAKKVWHRFRERTNMK